MTAKNGESPDLRHGSRIPKPLQMIIKGVVYTPTHWNVDGFLIDDFKGQAAVGEHLFVRLLLALKDFDLSFTTESSVVRRSEDKHGLAARFVQLKESEHELLELVMAFRPGCSPLLIEALTCIM
jgi:hypothetical protein